MKKKSYSRQWLTASRGDSSKKTKTETHSQVLKVAFCATKNWTGNTPLVQKEKLSNAVLSSLQKLKKQCQKLGNVTHSALLYHRNRKAILRLFLCNTRSQLTTRCTDGPQSKSDKHKNTKAGTGRRTAKQCACVKFHAICMQVEYPSFRPQKMPFYTSYKVDNTKCTKSLLTLSPYDETNVL